MVQVLAFRCDHPTGQCLLGLHEGLGPEYEVRGEELWFRDQLVGSCREQSLTDLVCGDHCNVRFLEEVVSQPGPPGPARLKVVKRHRIKLPTAT